MPLSEFQLIEKYFTHCSVERSDVLLGIGDDAALFKAPAGAMLVAAVDTLVVGAHFPTHTSPADIGYRALAVNLSDFAAMGAEPAWATLALTLPQADNDWLRDFSAGFCGAARQYNVQLVGGDTTKGPLTVTVQLTGYVPDGCALRRSGAMRGDLIYVTGTVGDAGLALALLEGQCELTRQQQEYILNRFYRPQPRVQQGMALRNLANAAIDVSDGLLADLNHILTASGVGATLIVDHVPVSSPLKSVLEQVGGWRLPLTAGDDYELCFTVPQEIKTEVEHLLERYPGGMTCIGMVENETGLRCKFSSGQPFEITAEGYDHFRQQD
jgi:thiamine-monophosphate kinase